MIQFNLLPTVKVEYLKIKRLKRLITISASAVIGVCVILVGSMFLIVTKTQQDSLKNLENSIKELSEKIKNTKDINKILTIQNQLGQIDKLHADKPTIEKVFTYITQITPKTISVQSFNLDLITSKIEVSGQAPSFEEMNKYIDTLKFTKVDYGDNNADSDIRAFPQVVLSSYSTNKDGAGFTVSITYLPDIFKSDKSNIKLVVPKITSTRSETERPTDLFKVNVTPTDGGDQ